MPRVRFSPSLACLRPRIGALAALIVMAALLFPAAAGAWNVTAYKGRSYVTLDDLASFYGFKKTEGPGKAFMLSSSGIEIRGTKGTKEITINRLRFYLSYSVITYGKRTLISSFDVAHLVDPVLRPPRQERDRFLRAVVIDPAHGGDEAGVVVGDLAEKNITMALARELRVALIGKGLDVHLTRDGDETLTPAQRAEAANAFAGNRECVFLSLHVARGSSSERGAETYTLAPAGTPATYDPDETKPDLNYYTNNLFENENIALATAIHGMLAAKLDTPDRGLRRGRFEELRRLRMPGLAARLGFLTNKDDAGMLTSPEEREKIVSAIAAGMERYIAYLSHGSPPNPNPHHALEISSIDVSEMPPDADGTRGRAHIVTASITRVGSAPVNPGLVDIQVYFFDLVDGEVIEPTAAEPPQVRWVSVLPNWEDVPTEILEVTCRERPGAADAAENRAVFGFVVRLIHDGKLQAVKASPPVLDRCLYQFYPATPR